MLIGQDPAGGDHSDSGWELWRSCSYHGSGRTRINSPPSLGQLRWRELAYKSAECRDRQQGELNRSQLIEVFDGMQLPIASRADAAASKLVWISKGSHKSRRDLRHIFSAGLDSEQASIRHLAEQLGLERLLNEVLNEPDEIRE